MTEQWKTFSIAVATVAVIAGILFGIVYAHDHLTQEFPQMRATISLVSSLFVALSLSILVVVALQQTTNVTWNGWKLSGVFAGTIVVISIVLFFKDDLIGMFDSDVQPPRLTQITFQCPNMEEGERKYYVDKVHGAEYIESIVVGIYGLVRPADRENLLDLLKVIKEVDGYNEIEMIDSNSNDYIALRREMSKHVGGIADSWIAYEFTTSRDSAFRTIHNMLLPIPLQASGLFPAIFFLKTKQTPKPGVMGATALQAATFSGSAPATGHVNFETFAHMHLAPKGRFPELRGYQFDRLQINVFVGVAEHRCQ